MLAGITVAVPLSPRRQRKAILAKIGEAIALIRRYTPRRFARLRRDVSGGILVFGLGGYRGTWVDSMRVCDLDKDYVISPDTTAADVASTLVHEALHARLFRRGFGYATPEERVRQEAACYRAELAFARRLPDAQGGAAQRARAQEWVDALREPDAFERQFSNNAITNRVLQEMRDTGRPDWEVRAFERLYAWAFAVARRREERQKRSQGRLPSGGRKGGA